MSRQQKFEQLWAERHGVPAESLVQYRFKDKDGYRLPGMAAHYRTFCDTLDSVAVELPSHLDHTGAKRALECEAEAIEAAGLKVKA